MLVLQFNRYLAETTAVLRILKKEQQSEFENRGQVIVESIATRLGVPKGDSIPYSINLMREEQLALDQLCDWIDQAAGAKFNRLPWITVATAKELLSAIYSALPPDSFPLPIHITFALVVAEIEKALRIGRNATGLVEVNPLVNLDPRFDIMISNLADEFANSGYQIK
jgi:hypothetical protein